MSKENERILGPFWGFIERRNKIRALAKELEEIEKLVMEKFSDCEGLTTSDGHKMKELKMIDLLRLAKRQQELLQR